MAASKYEKYFTRLPVDHGRGGELVGRFAGAKHFEGAPFTLFGTPFQFSRNLMK